MNTTLPRPAPPMSPSDLAEIVSHLTSGVMTADDPADALLVAAFSAGSLVDRDDDLAAVMAEALTVWADEHFTVDQLRRLNRLMGEEFPEAPRRKCRCRILRSAFVMVRSAVAFRHRPSTVGR